jgi:hypothetical protein
MASVLVPHILINGHSQAHHELEKRWQISPDSRVRCFFPLDTWQT